MRSTFPPSPGTGGVRGGRERVMGGSSAERVATDGSQMSVDVLEGDALGDHHHLEVVEQLADLFGGLVEGLVLAGHPHFCGLLDDLLADMVHARVELADGARSVGTNPGLLGEFGEQRLDILHPLRIRTTASGSGPGPRAGWR